MATTTTRTPTAAGRRTRAARTGPATATTATTARKATKAATRSTKATATRAATTATRSTKRAAKATTRTTKRAAKTATRATTSTATRAAKAAARPATAAATRRSTGRSARATNRDGVDALELLTADHREVDDLFERFEQTGPRAHKARQRLVERITVALSQHAAIEEDVFYPAARAEVSDTVDEVLEALEEHHLVKVTLAELAAMDPSAERYGAKVAVLIEHVRHHVQEEERELFPAVRREIDAARRRELGALLVEAKRTAPTRPHPEAPDTPPGSIVAQAISAPFDAAADLTQGAARRVRDLVT